MATALDKACGELDIAIQAIQDKEAQFYELFLNSELFMVSDKEPGEVEEGYKVTEKDEEFNTVLIENDGKLYIMLFDSKERLGEWAQREVATLAMQGATILKGFEFGPTTHIILNEGSENAKEFTPEEIAWLRSNIEEVA